MEPPSEMLANEPVNITILGHIPHSPQSNIKCNVSQISLLHQMEKLTREVPGHQHCGEDGPLELPPRVELLQAVHGLLTMNDGGNAFSLLKR